MKKIYYFIIFAILLNLTFVLAEDIPVEPTIICNVTQCDSSCVKCSDNKCHPEAFECIEELSLEKISPEDVEIGQNQINILLKNTGNVDLTNIYAKISGDGITTLEVIDDYIIKNLPIGQKDYAFVKINAEKGGDIDLIVKIYVNDNLLKQEIGSLFVIEEKKPVTPVETYNITDLQTRLTKLKEDYKVAEQDYQNKKTEGYILDIITTNLKDVDEAIKSAQADIYEKNYKKASVDIELAEDYIKSLQEKLANAKQKQETFGQKLKSNLTYLAGIAAALVSILTAYRLSSNYINKKKLIELHQKGKALLTPKQKEELKELEAKEKKKKAKKKLEKKEEKKLIKEDEE